MDLRADAPTDPAEHPSEAHRTEPARAPHWDRAESRVHQDQEDRQGRALGPECRKRAPREHRRGRLERRSQGARGEP